MLADTNARPGRSDVTRVRPARLLLVLLAVSLPTGCSGPAHADKSGAKRHSRVTLRLELPDAGDTEGNRFAADVAKRSHGSMRITIDLSGYSSSSAANELRLARALMAGREEIGYLPARAWAAARLPAFTALLAPFLVTTETTAQRLAAGPISNRILSTLPRSVVGVALVPAEPRRVLANRPIVSLDAFQGLRIRIVDNPQSAADFVALGATPLQGLTAPQVFARLRDGSVDAVESSPSAILDNGYFNLARNLSAYSVFPKFQSIVVSRRTWNRLSRQQQAAIREAASDTISDAGSRMRASGRAELEQLCQAHVRISFPTTAEWSALTLAVRPVIETLARNPLARTTLADIRRLPGAGAQPLASPLPSACRPDRAASARTPGKAAATIPNGVYTVTVTAAEWRAGGVINPDFKRDITYVTTMKDGRWYQTQAPNYPDQGPFSGTYTVQGNKLTWTMLKAGAHGQNAVTAPETVRWSYFDGKLRLQNVTVADPGSKVLYAAHPWRKIR